MMWIKDGFCKLIIWQSICNQGPSPRAISIKHLTPLCTTIPQPKLKDRLKELVPTLLHKKIGKILSCNTKQKHSDSDKHSETYVNQNVRVFDWQHMCYVWWCVFQETIGILMGIDSAPVLAVFIPYSQKADFMQEFLKKNEKKADRSFHFTFHCSDNVLSLSNSKLGDYVNAMLKSCFMHWPTSRNRHWRLLRMKLYRKKNMISIFPLWTFYLCVATFQQHMYMEYISLRWYDILEFAIPIRILWQ